jgi:hypothetical protein
MPSKRASPGCGPSWTRTTPAPLHLFSTVDRDISLNFITAHPTPERAGRVAPQRIVIRPRNEPGLP